MAKLTTDNTIAGLNRRLTKLPKEAKAQLREGSVKIAAMIAADAAGLARRVGGVLTYVAPTFMGTRDAVPTVKMGGAKRLPTSGTGWQRQRLGDRQTVGDVIWGAEFGGGARATTRAGGSTLQFMEWRGSDAGAGFALWPTVRGDREQINAEYSEQLRQAEGKI